LARFGQHIKERHHIKATLLVARLGGNNKPSKPPITQDDASPRHPTPACLHAGRGFVDIQRHPPLGKRPLGIHRLLRLTGRKQRPGYMLALPDRRSKITTWSVLYLGLREPDSFTITLGGDTRMHEDW
jgi:hypothetical protein